MSSSRPRLSNFFINIKIKKIIVMFSLIWSEIILGSDFDLFLDNFCFVDPSHPKRQQFSKLLSDSSFTVTKEHIFKQAVYASPLMIDRFLKIGNFSPLEKEALVWIKSIFKAEVDFSGCFEQKIFEKKEQFDRIFKKTFIDKVNDFLNEKGFMHNQITRIILEVEKKHHLTKEQQYEEKRKGFVMIASPFSKLYYADYLIENKIHKKWDGTAVLNDQDRFQETSRLYREGNGMRSYGHLLLQRYVDKKWDGTAVLNDQDRYEEVGRLFREYECPQSIYHYAKMLFRGEIHKKWDGTLILNDKDRYEEVGRLYRKSGIKKDLYSYVHLLEQGLIDKKWDGTLVLNDQDRYEEVGKLSRESDNALLKINYGYLLVGKHIHQKWNGEIVENDEARYKEAARLYKDSGLDIAKLNYGYLLNYHHIDEKWDGTFVQNDQDRWDEVGLLYRRSGKEEAKMNYALLLQEKKIFKNFEGKPFYKKEEMFDEIAKLCKESGLLSAKSIYASLLSEKEIHKKWDGTLVLNDQDRYREAVSLQKECSDEKSKTDFATLLKLKKIDERWDGSSIKNDQERFDEIVRIYKTEINPVSGKGLYGMLLRDYQVQKRWDGSLIETDQDRWNEMASLFRQSNEESIGEYALLLWFKKINKKWDGSSVDNEVERYEEVARLFRKCGTSVCQLNYVQLIFLNMVNRKFDGTLIINDQERFDEIVRICKENEEIPEAKFTFLNLILHKGYRKTLDGKTLISDQEAYQYVNDVISRGNVFCASMLLMEVHFESLNIPCHDFDMCYNEARQIYEKETALGNIDMKGDEIDFFYDEEISLQATEEEQSLFLEDSLGGGESFNECSSLLEKVKVEEHEKRSQIKNEFLGDIKFFRNESANNLKKMKVIRSIKNNKEKRLKYICEKSIQSSQDLNFSNYSIVWKNKKSSSLRINNLIESIKNKTQEGHPHMLKSKYGEHRLVSRYINEKDRLIYYFDHEKRQIVILQSEGHYND
ncbi:MAG: hypothetical protein HEEMFOPI_01552 [Holosporales bacterium]